MSLDLHNKPFDEGTIEKLWIFKNYINEWLPVFLSRPNPKVKEINICDFFAGPGKDTKGVDGSPIILLKSIKQYESFIKANHLKIQIHFNDYSKRKIESLKANIEGLGSIPENIEIAYSRHPFETAFGNISSKINKSNSANFFFLDQNGIKFITEDIFKKIIGFQKTDFIFFISSST
jgi:three-Cys-motif partner protein